MADKNAQTVAKLNNDELDVIAGGVGRPLRSVQESGGSQSYNLDNVLGGPKLQPSEAHVQTRTNGRITNDRIF